MSFQMPKLVIKIRNLSPKNTCGDKSFDIQCFPGKYNASGLYSLAIVLAFMMLICIIKII